MASPGTTATAPAEITRSCRGLPDDGFTLGSQMLLDVETRILRVSVSYGGGCEDHEFVACWNGAISKSNPATLTLDLRHDANNDLCDAFITRDLFIELAGIPAGLGAPERLGDDSIRLTELR